jgi:integrase
LAAKVALAVIEGKDPAGEKKAERMAGTFADLHAQYLELHAKKHNKSWKQADALVRRHLLPRWGALKASSISRSDVRTAMLRIEAPIVANQVLAAASAVFSWAVKQEILPTASRERVLSDAEIALLWPKLDPALKLILLTGQRPGEVVAMRREDIADGWWQMPGKPVGKWPGTKNGRDHRVWLSEPAQALVELHLAGRGKAPDVTMRALVTALGLERATPHDLRRTAL